MDWKQAVIDTLSQVLHKEIHEFSDRYIGGGSINDTRMIQTDQGSFFVKINLAERYPAMFEKEALGLKALNDAGVLRVPQVIATGESGKEAFLILEWIESAPYKSGFWEDFGKKMALLHLHHNDEFGFDHDNYIGSLPQSNRYHSVWSSFFVSERLEPQIKLARNTQKIDRKIVQMFERFFKKTPALFPEEKPSLVHGDLWSGNFMTDEKGEAVIMDPAVYYGHREMDLAMSQLFGGFDPRFYAAYHEIFPLESGWQERMDFCNLYPLMVHVNLFGGGYLNSVISILKRF